MEMSIPEKQYARNVISSCCGALVIEGKDGHADVCDNCRQPTRRRVTIKKQDSVLDPDGKVSLGGSPS